MKHEHHNLSVPESELILQGKSSAILLFTLHLCRIGVAYEFRLRQLFHASSLHKTQMQKYPTKQKTCKLHLGTAAIFIGRVTIYKAILQNNHM